MYDFNFLELSAENHMKSGEFEKALAIYFYMADGDPSLDGGYLGAQIAVCYERLGQKYAASYWYGRALEENPIVRAGCAKARDKLGDLTIDQFLISPK